MKNSIVFCCLLLVAATSIEAQTITLGPITKLAYCVGDTLVVPYQASGTFAADNHFSAQLSDPTGSFTTFTNFGDNPSSTGSISFKLNNTGDHYRLRMISTDPYTSSSDNGNDLSVLSYPSPQPYPAGDAYVGFAGDSITFSDRSSEPANSQFSWNFGQDASPSKSDQPSPKVFYPSEGLKSGTVVVTNGAGCAATVYFEFFVMSCDPTIPASAHVVTGTETGSYPNVWVKAGGNYTTSGEFTRTTVYAELGSSVRAEFRTIGLYYIKNGVSFISSNGQGYAAVILDSGTKITWDHYNDLDTFYCDNLTFDYSQVNASVAQPEASSISIRQAGDALFVEGEGNLEARIFNLLGNPIFSKHGASTLDLDLSSLPAGVYFAIVQAGDAREVRRIAVVH